MNLGKRLVNAPAGEPVSFEVMVRAQRQRPEIEILMALEYVQTRAGAERIHRAESLGRRRPAILLRAVRRLDDFDRVTTPTNRPKENAS